MKKLILPKWALQAATACVVLPLCWALLPEPKDLSFDTAFFAIFYLLFFLFVPVVAIYRHWPAPYVRFERSSALGLRTTPIAAEDICRVRDDERSVKADVGRSARADVGRTSGAEEAPRAKEPRPPNAGTYRTAAALEERLVPVHRQSYSCPYCGQFMPARLRHLGSRYAYYACDRPMSFMKGRGRQWAADLAWLEENRKPSNFRTEVVMAEEESE